MKKGDKVRIKYGPYKDHTGKITGTKTLRGLKHFIIDNDVSRYYQLEKTLKLITPPNQQKDV